LKMERRQRTRLASAGVVAVVFASGALVGMAVQRSLASEAIVDGAPQAPYDGPDRQGGPAGNRGRTEPRPKIYTQVLTPEQIVVADSLTRLMEVKRDELERDFRRDMDSIFDASARPQQHREERGAMIVQLRNQIRALMTPDQMARYDSLIAAAQAAAEERRRTDREQREQQQGQREGPGRQGQGRAGSSPDF
jgi:hypothetical protein